VSARETADVDDLVRKNVSLREQQRAATRVLRAVDAATRLSEAKNGRRSLFDP
jgi:hypothetical protein